MKAKQHNYCISIVLIGIVLLLMFPMKQSFAQHSPMGIGVAVVELFTSEGCSSCPAAEKTFAKLHDEFKDACFLEFHVDYWDDLGWKDIYGNKDYSARQKEYATTFGLGSVYTPQVIVNGSKEMIGSDEKKLRSAIRQFLKKYTQGKIELKATSTGRTVVISYFAGDQEGELNIALVRLKAESNVKRGENSGRKLVHTNVVVEFRTVEIEKRGFNIIMELPKGLSGNDCHVIAYIQGKGKKEITAAAETRIERE